MLQKFEVVLKINPREVLIPSLMPEEACYPKTNDCLSDITMAPYHEDCYQPPLHRFWPSNFIPEGFWPRLICRIVKDNQISNTLRMFTARKDASSDLLDWVLWRTGMVFVSRGRTLVVIRQRKNVQQEPEMTGRVIKTVTGSLLVDLHIYTPEMIQVLQELVNLGTLDEDVSDPFAITGHATRLLVAISNHILSLDSWFNSMLLPPHSHSDDLPNGGYAPCWKCYAEIEASETPPKLPQGNWILGDKGHPIFSFGFRECIVPTSRGQDLDCPFHGDIKVVHIAPDLVREHH